jgi:hypothetical protein
MDLGPPKFEMSVIFKPDVVGPELVGLVVGLELVGLVGVGNDPTQ